MLSSAKYILPFLLLAYLSQGCGGEEPPAPGGRPAIELSSPTATADPLTGKVSVGLTITDFAALARVEITVSGDGAPPVAVETLPKSRLTPAYTWEYTLPESDTRRFIFYFRAVSSSGLLSEAKTLEVERAVGQVALSIDEGYLHLPHTGRDEEFSTTLTIDNFDRLDYLLVERTDWGESTFERIWNEELSERHIFRRTATAADSDLFLFRFTAVDLNGVASASRTLTVDRRSALGFTDLTCVSRVTGAEDDRAPMPAPAFRLDNRTHQRYNVGGTDLGIVWELDEGRYGLFFGDTFGIDFTPNFAAPGPNGGSWRSNVLLFSDDGDLSDGMTIDGAATDMNGYAREICFGGKQTDGTGDYTSIPTAAIRANGADYVHYMNIRTRDGWKTNLSSLYRSADDGVTWERCRDMDFGSLSNFGQVGLHKKDGYVYMVGTVAGRDNKPHLARFREQDIEEKNRYEYWNAVEARWSAGDESAATPLFDDIAGELSIAWHRRYGKWIMLYFSGPRYEITFREANEITGPWSAPRRIAGGEQYPQLYGSYIHPRCLDSEELYFVMSMWLPYNTYLMSVDLVRE